MTPLSDFCNVFLKNLNSKYPAYTILSLLMVLIMQVTCYVPQDLHEAKDCPLQCSCASPQSLQCWATPPYLPPSLHNLTLRGVPMAPLQDSSHLHILSWTHSGLGALSAHLFEHNPALIDLDLSSDDIESVDNLAFAGLASLQRLDLSNNSLSDVPQDVFAGLSSLVFLSLRDNKFESLPFYILTPIKPSLATLDLSWNRLVTVAGEFFHPAPQLHTILLADNRLTKLPGNAFAELPGLRTLDLARNRLTDLPRQLFTKLSALTYLNLGHNNLTRLYANIFKDLKKLNTLNLSHNPIQNLTEKQFESCTLMEQLYMVNTEIQALNQLHFEGLGNLRVLMLDENSRLSRLARFVFQPTPRLEVLSLSRTNLTTLPDTLSALHNLTRLDITNNPLVCDCALLWLEAFVGNQTRPLGVEEARCRHAGIHTYTNLLRTLRSLSCLPPNLVYSSEIRLYRLSSDAYLECNFRGSPQPSVTWLTPTLDVYHYNPDPSLPDLFAGHPPAHDEFMQPIRDGRHEVLDNGTLHILDVHRADAGEYICLGSNPLANVTATVHLHIDPILMHDIKINGLLFGALAAVIFLVLTLFIQLLRALFKR